MAIVGQNRDFEVLAMARKVGAKARDLARINRRLREVEDANRTVVTPPAGINNLLIGSDFDHSIFTFNGSGSHTDLINWFRGVNPALPVGTAASNPAWRMETDLLDWVLGGDFNDLSYRFSKRLIRPGQTLYLMFNARLRDAGVSGAGLLMEAGIWDTTGGINNWVSASVAGPFGQATITVTKIGPGAAATNYTYVVVAFTDENEVIVSAPQSVLGAAALNSTDFNQVRWALTGGVLEYRIFRTTPNPGLIGVVGGGASIFNDQGTALLIPNAPIPQPSGSQARVFINNFGLQLTTRWQTVRAAFRVPRNYNFSQTAPPNNQWLRMGLRGSSSAVIQVDRVGLSLSPGAWQPSVQDRMAVNDVEITTSGDFGGQTDIGFTDTAGVRFDEPPLPPEVLKTV
jgi:hypothetical protein